ncbi:YCF48-related protein [Burkholderia sp. S171]|uniref:YCF48-related protein n=1 Tax=Burkholderia sp. S171 TaxID=1641860 RepID=UPI00131C90DD
MNYFPSQFRRIARISVFAMLAVSLSETRVVAAPGPASDVHVPRLDPRLPAERLESAQTSAILGAVRAGGRIVSVGERGAVLLSDDDGKTFRQAAFVPTRATLTSVYFANDRVGWAAGHWGVVLHTEDSGEHWTVQRSDVSVDRPLFSVYFRSQTEGWAVGLWSLMLHTTDAGRTWTEVKLPVPAGATKADGSLYAMTGRAQGSLYIAAERGLVVESKDGGVSWSYSDTGFKGSLWSAIVLKDNVVLVGGLRGGIFRSSDGGETWTAVQTQFKDSITGIAQNPDASVTAVALDGVQLVSRDNGVSFSGSQRADRATITAVAPLGEGGPLLFSTGGPLKAE